MEENSSEEDFEYLQQYLEEHKQLPPGSMRLLRNVVSTEYKDRKFPGRFGRGQEVADEPVEGEVDHDQSDIDLMKDAKIWTKGRAGGRTLGQPSKGFTNEDYDKMKDMSGEEQLRYMNQVFNFYAMDEPAQKPKESSLPPIDGRRSTVTSGMPRQNN